MTLLRRLNEDGIKSFVQFIEDLNQEKSSDVPEWLLDDPRYSSSLRVGDIDVQPLGEVEPKDFETRGEFACYLDSRIREAGILVDVDEPGLWEWLSLFYFDAVCPMNLDGTRRVGDLPRYVLHQRGWHYRHLLRESYMLYRMNDRVLGNPADFLLHGPVNEHGTLFEHLCARPRLRNSSAVLQVARLLYCDANGVPKSGVTVGETSIQNFGRIIRGLPERYDLETISADTVMVLLPEEFDRWIDDSDAIRELRDTRSMLGSSVKDLDYDASPVDLAELLQHVEERTLTHSQRRVRSDKFRIGVLVAYESVCAISGIGLTHRSADDAIRYEVDAAHIIPVAHGGSDLIQNGLALSRTVHWAFDHGMIWIDSDLQVRLSNEVWEDRRNEWLRGFGNQTLLLPKIEELHPHRDALRWHAENIAGLNQ